MRKLIHSDFELDLSNYKVSVVRENQWFSDQFFTKFSFPFDIDLTDELDALLGFISRYNSTDVNTIIECKYYHNNEVEDAILEIEQHQEKLSCVLYFGYDQLPNFDKKLSELPLDKFELPEGVSIYQHAETIITQSWPDVNYNFPQIHTDKIDPDSDDVWFAFEKIINNYKDGAFLINEVVPGVGGADDEIYNRNIMQPLPYELHVLKKGFEDIGLSLSGDILNDTRFQKKLIFADVDYATTVTQESITILKMSQDNIETGTITENLFGGGTRTYSFNRYLITQPIDNPGRYRIIGKVVLFSIINETVYLRIKYRNQIIWQHSYSASINQPKVVKGVNVVFDTLVDLNPNEIVIESWQRAVNDNQIIVDLDINPVRLHDAEGNPIPSIINKNEIDLTKAVPDITFGDKIREIKNWFNYDLEIQGNLAIMNRVQNKLVVDSSNALDLTEYEVKRPLRKFPKGISFLLKFQDVDSKDYTFLPVFQNANGFVNSSFVTNEKTNTIEINALPLPLLVRNGVQTAHAFEQNNAKAYYVLYDGLTDSLNLAKNPEEILLPAVHLQDWKQWFDFRINAQEFTWPLKMLSWQFQKIKTKTIIYAYKKYHLIKIINDTEYKPGEFEVELETVSFE